MHVLSVLVVAVLAQRCEFTAEWQLPREVELRTERGVVFGSVVPSQRSPSARVTLHQDGSAAVVLRQRGVELKARVSSLPVTMRKPPQFGHGYTAVESSMLKVVRGSGNSFDVIPWPDDELEVRFSWKPARVECASLRLGSDVGDSCSAGGERFELSEVRDGAVAYVVRTSDFDVRVVKKAARVRATLRDGSQVEGWTRAMTGGSYGSSCGQTSCEFGPKNSHSCADSLTLFARTQGGEEAVGTVDAETPFEIVSEGAEWIEVRSFVSAKLFVRRADVKGCLL